MSLKQAIVGDIVIDFPQNESFILTSTHVPLGSSGFIYEHNVIKSTYNPAACQLFSWFRSMHSSCGNGNTEAVIKKMTNTYKKHKTILSSPLREYVLIEGIVELCYRFQLENNSLVHEILDEIYETWSSFGPLHFAIIFKPEIFRSRGKIHKGILPYFLEHARRLKLEYNGKRAIDVSMYSSMAKLPVFAAAETWCWRSLLKYLQYGARFEDVMVSPALTRHGVSLAMIETLRNFIQYLWFSVEHYLNDLETENEVNNFISHIHPEVGDLLKTFSIILRVVKRIQRDKLMFSIVVDHDQRVEEISSLRVLCHSIVQVTLPTLSARCEPLSDLKHSCRWIIRKRLNENWQLPHGIQYLPLPKKMKKYLNLLVD